MKEREGKHTDQSRYVSMAFLLRRPRLLGTRVGSCALGSSNVNLNSVDRNPVFTKNFIIACCFSFGDTKLCCFICSSCPADARLG